MSKHDFIRLCDYSSSWFALLCRLVSMYHCRNVHRRQRCSTVQSCHFLNLGEVAPRPSVCPTDATSASVICDELQTAVSYDGISTHTKMSLRTLKIEVEEMLWSIWSLRTIFLDWSVRRFSWSGCWECFPCRFLVQMRVAVGQEKPKSSIQSKLTATFENPNQPKSVSSTANGRVGFRSVSAPLALR